VTVLLERNLKIALGVTDMERRRAGNSDASSGRIALMDLS
jgi:hypothetical protein